MGLFQRLFSAFNKKAPQGAGIPPTAAPANPQPTRPKTLAELEQEIEQQAKLAAQQSRQSTPRSARQGSGFIGRLKWTLILLGIPVGALAIANSSFPPIRQAVSEKAPVLLLPSYVMMDHSFRQAIALVEQSQQLIDSPTSASDLELGAQKLRQARANLDALPIGVTGDRWLMDWSNYGWYGRRFTVASLNQSRATVGRLEAKLFQEQNGQKLLAEARAALTEAKQQVQEAATPAEKQGAIAAWQDSLDRLRQLPPNTLSGRMAQQILATEQQNFAAIAGQAAGDQQTSAMINAAKQFAMQAAQMAQNPPHSAEKWQQIEGLWQQAIARLQQISPNDPTSYTEAQNLLANYLASLGQIQVRKAAEIASVEALEKAKNDYARLIASLPASGGLDRNVAVGRIQEIMNSLDQVQSGTTAYAEAQVWIRSAQKKLQELGAS